ncbi:methyl-accepting chemotaxis protein, partial [Dokdonella sp.]|uniref:methyl-accepting chemotaxis protein n=1 Tax=Dokdonella sp. TaxID=2291710 RepID=UPI002F42DCB2
MSTTSGAVGLERGGRANTVLFVVLGILFVIAIANFVLLYFQNVQDRKAVAYTTQIQVSSQQLAKYAAEAASGNELAFQELKSTSENINAYVEALNQGDKTGMKGYASKMPKEIGALTSAWKQLQADAKKIIDNQAVVLTANTNAKDFVDKVSALNSRMSEVVNILTDRNASASQVYIASRQMQLADRMSNRVTRILVGGADTQLSADGLGRDSRLYQTVVNGLLEGAPELNIKPLDNAAAKQIVGDVAQQWTAVTEPVKTIVDSAPNLQAVKDASDKSFTDSQDVLLRAVTTAQTIDAMSSTKNLANFRNPLWGALAAAIAMLLLLFLGYNLIRDQRRRLQQTNELNQRNQDAILRLLDEMGSLAEGDLTVKATVTEDITGAIADSVNFAVEALRSLVTTINETAVQVSAAAQETQATAMQLADAAQHQARQISSASVAINDMATSIDNVSKNSAESADVAQRSVQIAANGAQVVRQTIQGMDSIRDQIQETSKRIKRLGESSQEIGAIVELINDLAEQTNILALN